MATLPFSTVDLTTTDIDAISSIFEALKKDFEISYELDLPYKFIGLEVFSNREFSVGPAIKINNSIRPFYLAFIHVGYSYSYARRYSFGLNYEYQTWGLLSLKNDAGRILIKPETLIDKIHELINPVEIDFQDDREFSKQFYVVTDDETKARAQLSQAFRTEVREIPVKEFIIEILHDQLIIGHSKPIERDTAVNFVRFMNRVLGNSII